MSKNVNMDKLINQCELIRDTLNSGCVECDFKANEPHLKSKQVEYTEYDGYVDGCPVYETGICPNCNREFEVQSEEHYSYCPSCGQKLKW